MIFFRTEYKSWYSFPFPADVPNPEIEPRSPALQTDSFPAEPQVQFSSVQSLSHVQLFTTSWTAARQIPCLSPIPEFITLMSIELVMPSSHLTLCHLLLLPPSIFPSIRVFSNESILHIRCTKYWSFSFSIIPSNQYSGLISFRMN